MESLCFLSPTFLLSAWRLEVVDPMSISLDDDKSRLLSENSMFWSLISSDCEKVSLKVEEEKARGEDGE